MRPTSPLLKAALAWILALGLPLQGLAAATMLHCAQGPAPHAVAAVHQHAGHHGAATAPGVVHGAAAHHATDAADGGTHQCSACAACVVGAALPPSAVSVTLPVESAGAMLPAPVPGACSVVLAGLERPPRSHLA